MAVAVHTMSVSAVSMTSPSRTATVVLPLFAEICTPPEVPPGFLSALVLVPPTVASLVMMYSPPALMEPTLTYLSTTGAVTVTTQVSVKPPSLVVTVMVAVPAEPPLTVAIVSSLLVQVTPLLVAFAGVNATARFVVLPTSTLAVSSIETPSTATGSTGTSVLT